MDIKKYFNEQCEMSPKVMPESPDIKPSIKDTINVDLTEFAKQRVTSIEFEIDEFA